MAIIQNKWVKRGRKSDAPKPTDSTTSVPLVRANFKRSLRGVRK